MGDETLLERILNGHEEPKDLPLALLQSITNDFSQERKIGQGGFGVVYKGELQNGIIVAVKRIEVNQITIDDVSFRREFNSLMNTNHQNVVRFLGFCSNTHHIPRKEAGEINLVSVRERLLCFEYIRNGSLDKHITDELRGLEWEPRYAIISGICKGLFYLHEEKNFVHMDLKPPNILLDDHMVPKITDFGLSRSNEMSHTTGQRFGTPGYVAPEYEKDGKTSFKCDIYSLGVIITELVTGCKSVPHKNNVLRRWRHRWNKPPTLLQYRQVTRCIEILVRCRKQESGRRPSILEIISILGESESTDGHTDQESAYLDDDMLRIEPLELKLNEEMSWSVKLTNKTKASFAFNIERSSQQYTIWPDKGIVTPGCNEYLVQITLQPQQRAPQVTQNADKLIFQSTKVSEGLRDEDITENIFHEEAGKVVDEVDLMIVYEPTKPKENCKSREDTNMPAEEVPEAKGRKIVKSAFGKGKLGSREKAEAASMGLQVPDKLSNASSGRGPLDVVIVYAFDCTDWTSAWYTVDKGIFWMVQEKLTHFVGSCMGYIYVMSTPNTYTSDMKVVDPADAKTGYTAFARHRLTCTKNMASGLAEAHKMISSCGHHNSIILFFSDGFINKGDFFDGTENFVSKVPVHTFTLAGDAYNHVLHSIAENSAGGKFHTTPVPERPNLSAPFSKLLDSLLGGTPKDDLKPPSPISGREPLGVVIVYAFDCTNSTPAWYTVDNGIFWLVQEKLTHFADSSMGYIYVMSTPNTYTSDMKVVDPVETKETGYTKFDWRRMPCTKNMASGLAEAHKMISNRGYRNGIILFFSDGLINEGDFFDGTENFISKVPVHTFTLGGDAYNHGLQAIAANSPGGTFNPFPVPEKPHLSAPFSKLLDSLLSGTTKD